MPLIIPRVDETMLEVIKNVGEIVCGHGIPKSPT
jgi:hypothetical protein